MMQKLLLRRHLIRLLARTLPRINTTSRILIALRTTTINALDTRTINHLPDRNPLLGNRVQHLQDQTLDRRGIDIGEDFPAFGVSVGSICDDAVWMRFQPFVPALFERGIVLEFRFRGLPWRTTECHGQKHNSAGPHVQRPRIIIPPLLQHLWRNIR